MISGEIGEIAALARPSGCEGIAGLKPGVVVAGLLDPGLRSVIPLGLKKISIEKIGRVPNGSGGRDRTYDLVVNSHPLCR